MPTQSSYTLNVNIDGNKKTLVLPSVTTIIGYDTNKSSLIKWAKVKEKWDKEHGEGSWDLYMRLSADRGTTIHHYIEQVLTGNIAINDVRPSRYTQIGEYELDRMEKLKLPREFFRIDLYWNSCKKWLTQIIKQGYTVDSTELSGINPKWLYGGTTDLILTNQLGHRVLVDIKTHSGYYFTTNDGTQIYNGKYYHWRKGGKTNPLPTDINQLQWSDIADKAKKAFMQCIMYRMMCESGYYFNTTNPISKNINEIKIVAFSKDNYYVLDLLNPKWDTDHAIKFYLDAQDEVINLIKLYHQQETKIELPHSYNIIQTNMDSVNNINITDAMDYATDNIIYQTTKHNTKQLVSV